MAEALKQAAEALRQYALSLPGAYEEFPWGERVIKVNKKIFVFLGSLTDTDQQVYLGVKLPLSHGEVLKFPYAEPSGYGLGKSGWVSVRYVSDEPPPLDLFICWVEESYCAIAPKKLVAQFEAEHPPTQ